MSDQRPFSAERWKLWEEEGHFLFLRDPLEKVCSILSSHFDVEIKVDPAFTDKKITAKFHGDDAEDIMLMLSKMLNAELTTEADSFRLNPKE